MIKYLCFIFTLCFCSCEINKKKDELNLSYEKVYNFGEINLKDTIVHSFKIINNSEKQLKIKKIGASCGCTSVSLKDSVVSKDGYTEIKVVFIPNKDNIGKIKNSIVFEANTNPTYNVVFLEGIVNE